MNIWCNVTLSDKAKEKLSDGLKEHNLLINDAPRNPFARSSCDIIFGQPDPEECLKSQIIK